MTASIDSLSRQQRRCLEAVGRGLTSPEIAHELGIAESTVNVHIKAAIVKLGAPNRRHAAQMVLASFKPDTQKLGSQNLAIDEASVFPTSTTPHRVEEAATGFVPFPNQVQDQGSELGNDAASHHQTIRTIAWIAATLILLLIALGPIAENATKLANLINPQH